ncbi:MAG: ATP-binding protein, partial [Acidobacteriota bacterium]
RLQTERDKARVMDGLLQAEGAMSKKQLETLLSGLDKRVFLLHNVHEDAPVLYRVRWAMSYLCGPLTRSQIKTLRAAEPERKSADAEAQDPAPSARARIAAPPPPAARPVLPSGVRERFLPSRAGGEGVRYRPAVIGAARVHFVNARKGLEAEEEVLFLADLEDGEIDWRRAELLEDLAEDDLEKAPEDGADFAELPAPAAEAKSYRGWSKDFSDMLYRERRWELLQSPALGLIAEPGESERDFRVRLGDAAREQRDVSVEKLRKKYARRFQTLRDRLRRAEQKVEKEEEQASSSKMQSLLSVGTTVLGALMSRKTFSATNMRKASSAMRRVGRSAKEGQDVDRARENVEAVSQQLADLEAELQDEILELEEKFDAQAEQLEVFELKPRRTDIDLQLVALAWCPYRVRDEDAAEAAW